MRKLTYHIVLLFSLSGILFIPFSFSYFTLQTDITRFVFEDLILFIASNFESIRIVNPEISSDSTTLYLLLSVLLFVSVLLAITFPFFTSWKKHQASIEQAIQLSMTFYLSAVMLKYGVDKIFKAQFYLPEPNTLFTPLGMLDKDILYWSSMGVSYSYNVFMGFSEAVPAILLLYRKTRAIGLIILAGVLTNVVFINLGFDISVKLYSSFLWLLCISLLIPSMNTFFKFFILNETAALTPIAGKDLIPSSPYRYALKSIVLIILFMESLFPYIQSGQYNDDKIPRNQLHGAYEILEIQQSKAYENNFKTAIKRIFIHRQNYFIFQYQDDSTEDYRLEIDADKGQMTLTDYEGGTIKIRYKYSETSKLMELKFIDFDMTIISKALPWRDLPLLQPLFHWTVDGVNG